MTIIIRPPAGGLSMQDLLVTLDAMRIPGEPPLRTGNGGFVVGEDLARRFLAALAADREPSTAVAHTPPPATWTPPVVGEPDPPHNPPSAAPPLPTTAAPPPPVTTADQAKGGRRTSRSRRTPR